MSVQILMQSRLVNVAWSKFSFLHIAEELFGRVSDLRSAAVAERNGQMELVEMCGFLLSGPDPMDRRRGKRFDAAYGTKPDTLLDELGSFGGEIMLQESHQRVDFLRRTIPIFLRKGIDRQGLDAEFETVSNDFPHGLDACSMTGNARQTAEFCPAAISIHDYGDMFWKEVRFEFRGQFVLGQMFEG